MVEDEADDDEQAEIALQTMPQPQLLTTGLSKGETLMLLMKAVIGDVAILLLLL